MMQAPLRLLLDLVDEAFDRKAWHGTTLLGSIRGVPAGAAAVAAGSSPAQYLGTDGARGVLEVRRAPIADWREARLVRAQREQLVHQARDERWMQTSETWPADVRLLIAEHRRLRATIAALPERALERRLEGKRYTAAFTIRGIAAHDLYHAGQIQLIKRLHG